MRPQRLGLWKFLLGSLVVTAPAAPQTPGAPTNSPATLEVSGTHIVLRYDGREILTADFASSPREPAPVLQTLVDSATGAVTQVVKWTDPSGSLSLAGVVAASDEAFPAEVDRRDDGLRIVRHSIGQSVSRLNRAVYDRSGDWVLSVDFPARVRITPAPATGATTTYRFEASGGEIGLRFRPRFFQRHRGLSYYEPWTYHIRRDVPIGWSSWYAFRDRVTEDDVHRIADAMRATLAPYGYRYLQLDDGYQRSPIGVPDHWTQSNAKFPSGMAALAQYIIKRGLEPAIWTNVSFQDQDWATTHAEYFVRDSSGKPAKGNWIGYVMDGSNPATLRDIVLPVYAEFRRMGYTYFKVDALRHLRYEGYNSNAGFFTERHLNRADVLRDFVRRIREEIGPANFLLACWGIRPELVGLVDAVRIGGDGFGFGGLAQYNSYNNVVWRNDPDHVELSAPDAFAATTAASLTGSHLMLTDPPAVYGTPRVEAARRVAPVLFTVPGQLYDVDPSRSSQLAHAHNELSGGGSRPLDADQVGSVHLYALDVNRPFENWTVLGRTGLSDPRIRFADLGLADSTDYLVFEFWTKQFRGRFRDTLPLGNLNSVYRAESLCIRERQVHPQILATNRHITCGAPDLLNVVWANNILSGASEVVGGDEYAVYLTEPSGYRMANVRVEGATLRSAIRIRGGRVLRLLRPTSGVVQWKVFYRR